MYDSSANLFDWIISLEKKHEISNIYFKMSEVYKIQLK